MQLTPDNREIVESKHSMRGFESTYLAFDVRNGDDYEGERCCEGLRE